MVKDGKHKVHFYKLAQVNGECEIYGEVFVFKEPEFIEFHPYCAYTKPLEINIDVYGWYEPDVEEEEEDVKVEITQDEEPVPSISSFRERSCVVCLSEDPNVLFYDCRHICVCQECEERNPLSRCPVCRVHASVKVII